MSKAMEEFGGGFQPMVPEPLWYGWRLRKARCSYCNERFGKDEMAYGKHWLIEHAATGSDE